MKRFLIIVLGFASIAAHVFAHDPAMPLPVNGFSGSFFFYPTGGMDILLDAEGDNIRLTTMVVSPVTPCFSNGFSGSYLLGEYGILDQLSIGMKLNAIDFLVHGLGNGEWILEGSLFLRANLPVNLLWEPLRMHLVVESNVAPLYSDKNYGVAGFGLINLFCTLSTNIEFLHIGDIRLFFYNDLKYITSFIDPRRNAGAWLEMIYPTESRDPSVSYVIGITHRFAYCPGIEFNWGNFSANFGWNMRIADLTVPGSWTMYWQSPDRFFGTIPTFEWLNRLEFSWRWRF